MEEKFTAVYVMVRQDELRPEDEGSYEKPLEKQKEECLRFLKENPGTDPQEHVEVYSNRKQLLMDVERHRIKRLVVHSLDRLGSSQDEIEGVLFELRSEGVEVVTVAG